MPPVRLRRREEAIRAAHAWNWEWEPRGWGWSIPLKHVLPPESKN